MPEWFTPSDPTWEPAQLPAARYYPVHFTAGGRLWLLGGMDGTDTEVTTAYAYDPVTNAWTSEAAIGQAMSAVSKAAVISGVAYMVTGYGTFSYDTTTGAWTVLTDSNQGADWGYDAIALGGYVYWYLSGGTPQRYDPSLDTWINLTPGPAGWNGTRGVRAETDGTHIYLLDADAGGQRLLRYDPASDAWTTLAAPPAVAFLWGALTYDPTNHRLIAQGGEDEGLQNYEYDIAGDTWTQLTDRPAALIYGAAGMIDDRLYTAGGTTTFFGNATTRVDMYGDSPPAAAEGTLSVTYTVPVPTFATLAVTYDPGPVLAVNFDVGVKAGEQLSDQPVLAVTVDEGYDPEAALETTWRTGWGGDVNARLRVNHNTIQTREATLHVIHDPVAADGQVGTIPDAGPTVTGTIQEGLGMGATATLESVDGTVPSATARLEQAIVETGTPVHVVAVERSVMPAPYGRGYRTEGLAPVHTLTTPDPRQQLDDTILPELVKVPTITGGGIGYAVQASGAMLTSLDAPLGTRMTSSSDDCNARPGVDVTRQTRLDLAREAVQQAGMTLIVLGNIPNSGRYVKSDYTTEGKTAAAVLSDMLMGANPRSWYTPTTVTIDARIIATSAGSTDPTAFLDAKYLADDGASFQDQAGASELEPTLADYTDRCERTNPAATDPDETDADVPSTFETLTDGTYSWLERAGSGDDYREIERHLRKAAGQLVEEATLERGRFRLNYDSQLLQWGPVRTVNVQNMYDDACRDALTTRTEVTNTRKRVADIGDVSNTIGSDDGQALEPGENERLIYDAIPAWYVEQSKLVQQWWHAEGWLKSRSETTRRMNGMIATPQLDVDGNLTGYTVELTYDVEARSETYLPIGRGLWHVQTSITTTEQRPVYELVNPEAVEGDPDYGVTELVSVQAVPVSNTYTEVTDQAPPSVACSETPSDPDDPCSPTDDYAKCLADALEAFEMDHATWTARQSFAGPKRVWTLAGNRLLPDVRVGQVRGGGLVTRVDHELNAASGTTTFTLWEFLA